MSRSRFTSENQDVSEHMTGWTLKDHDHMVCRLSELGETVSEVAKKLGRTDGAIKARMRLVILEYYINQNMSIDEIVSTFDFANRQFVERTISHKDTRYKHILGKNFKECSKYAIAATLARKEAFAKFYYNSNGL